MLPPKKVSPEKHRRKKNALQARLSPAQKRIQRHFNSTISLEFQSTFKHTHRIKQSRALQATLKLFCGKMLQQNFEETVYTRSPSCNEKTNVRISCSGRLCCWLAAERADRVWCRAASKNHVVSLECRNFPVRNPRRSCMLA